MSLYLVLSLQAAAVATPAAPAPPPAIAPLPRPRWAMADPRALRFGEAPAFGPVGPAGTCPGGGGADVLVCGPRRSGGDYPMARWTRIFGPEAPLRAERDLGGGWQGRVYTEAVPMDRGAVSNRALIGLRTRF